MNPRISSITLCITLITAFAHGMSQVKIDQSFSLTNTIDDAIEVSYRLKGDKECVSEKVISEQIFTLPSLSEIEELYVLPYGKIKGKFCASYLTGGLTGKNNLVNRDGFKEALEGNTDCQLAIENHPSNNVFTNALKKRLLPFLITKNDQHIQGSRDGLGGITTCSYEPYYLKKNKDKAKLTIIRFFPQALKVWDDLGYIPARYLLNLTEEASEESIKKAYAKILMRWEPLLEHDKECMRDLANNILYIVEQAYKKLLNDENNEFEIMKTNNFYDNLTCAEIVFAQEETINGTHGSLTDEESIDFTRGKSIFTSPSCNELLAWDYQSSDENEN